MAGTFSTGLSMGMELARDVRSANVAAAERRERSKYRKKADKRAERADARADREMGIRESAEQRAVSKEGRDERESNMRIKSLKSGMERGKEADKRARRADARDAAESSSRLVNNNLQRRIAEQKLNDAQNPMITNFRQKRGLAEEYRKTLDGANARHAARMGPINKAVEAARQLNQPHLVNLEAMQKRENEKHKGFLSSLEHAFMSASSQPHTGVVGIRPFMDQFSGQMNYGVTVEGASPSEARAFMETLKATGAGVSAVPSGRPAEAVDLSDPLGIRKKAEPATP